MFSSVSRPEAASGTSTEVVIDDDCTAMVTTTPSSIATTPEPAPSVRLIAASTLEATSNLMFRVMKARARNMRANPTTIIMVPFTFPRAPRSTIQPSTQPAGIFTAAFNGLLNDEPELPITCPVIQPAVLERYPVASSIGRNSATARMLKKSWMVAAANARRNSCSRRRCPSDARVLVTVVPRLAPITIGTASSIPTTPLATRPTITDVETDDDCTSTVARRPTHSPPIGLETPSNRPSTRSLPRFLKPPPSSSTPVRNR